MDPSHLRAQADSLDGEAIELARRGDVVKGLLRAAEAMRLRELADGVERLRSGDHGGNLSGMLPAARVRQAKGATKGRKASALSLVASDAGHTIRSIAEALGCSHVFLLKALRGDKAIRYSWAQRVQAMTRSEKHPDGFQATGANWRGGWAREE